MGIKLNKIVIWVLLLSLNLNLLFSLSLQAQVAPVVSAAAQQQRANMQAKMASVINNYLKAANAADNLSLGTMAPCWQNFINATSAPLYITPTDVLNTNLVDGTLSPIGLYDNIISSNGLNFKAMDNSQQELLKGLLYFGSNVPNVDQNLTKFWPKADGTIGTAATLLNFFIPSKTFFDLTVQNFEPRGILIKNSAFCAALNQALGNGVTINGKNFGPWTGATCQADQDCCYGQVCLLNSGLNYADLPSDAVVSFGICDTPVPQCVGVPGVKADLVAGCCAPLVHDLGTNNCVLNTQSKLTAVGCATDADCSNNYKCNPNQLCELGCQQSSDCLSTDNCDLTTQLCQPSALKCKNLSSRCLTSTDCCFSGAVAPSPSLGLQLTTLICDGAPGAMVCKGAQGQACTEDANCAANLGCAVATDPNFAGTCRAKASNLCTVNLGGVCGISGSCCAQDGWTCGLINVTDPTKLSSNRVCCIAPQIKGAANMPCAKDADCCYDVNGSVCDQVTKLCSQKPSAGSNSGVNGPINLLQDFLIGSGGFIVGTLLLLLIRKGARYFLERKNPQIDEEHIEEVSESAVAEAEHAASQLVALTKSAGETPGTEDLQAVAAVLHADSSVIQPLYEQVRANSGSISKKLHMLTDIHTAAATGAIDLDPAAPATVLAVTSDQETRIRAASLASETILAASSAPAGTSGEVIPARPANLPTPADLAVVTQLKTDLITLFIAQQAGQEPIKDVMSANDETLGKLILVDAALRGAADTLGGVDDGPRLAQLIEDINGQCNAFHEVFTIPAVAAAESLGAGARLQVLINTKPNNIMSFTVDEMKTLSANARILASNINKLKAELSLEDAAGVARYLAEGLRTEGSEEQPGEPYFHPAEQPVASGERSPELPFSVDPL